jgi:hypothetical protein
MKRIYNTYIVSYLYTCRGVPLNFHMMNNNNSAFLMGYSLSSRNTDSLYHDTAELARKYHETGYFASRFTGRRAIL